MVSHPVCIFRGSAFGPAHWQTDGQEHAWKKQPVLNFEAENRESQKQAWPFPIFSQELVKNPQTDHPEPNRGKYDCIAAHHCPWPADVAIEGAFDQVQKKKQIDG